MILSFWGGWSYSTRCDRGSREVIVAFWNSECQYFHTEIQAGLCVFRTAAFQFLALACTAWAGWGHRLRYTTFYRALKQFLSDQLRANNWESSRGFCGAVAWDLRSTRRLRRTRCCTGAPLNPAARSSPRTAGSSSRWAPRCPRNTGRLEIALGKACLICELATLKNICCSWGMI